MSYESRKLGWQSGRDGMGDEFFSFLTFAQYPAGYTPWRTIPPDHGSCAFGRSSSFSFFSHLSLFSGQYFQPLAPRASEREASLLFNHIPYQGGGRKQETLTIYARPGLFIWRVEYPVCGEEKRRPPKATKTHTKKRSDDVSLTFPKAIHRYNVYTGVSSFRHTNELACRVLFLLFFPCAVGQAAQEKT